MSLLSKYWKAGVSLLFGIGIFLFWWRAYPVMLSFQEQYQLFLYDGTYLAGLLSVPDGFCLLPHALRSLIVGVPIGIRVLFIILILMPRPFLGLQIEDMGAFSPLINEKIPICIVLAFRVSRVA